MKLNDIERPKIIPLNENGLRVEISAPRYLFNEKTGEIIDILIAPTIVLSDDLNSDEKFKLPIDSKMFNEETYKQFNNFTYSLGKMVRLAELNLDALIGVVKLYINLTPVSELIQRNADCKKLKEYDIDNRFNKLTFGNLRNILSCIIKSDTGLHTIPGLMTPEDRKNFTSVYKNYIDDRDCYTHGILFFLYPTMGPILRIKAQNGDDAYIKYEKEVFSYNLLTYSYLSKIISDIRELLQNRINMH